MSHCKPHGRIHSRRVLVKKTTLLTGICLAERQKIIETFALDVKSIGKSNLTEHCRLAKTLDRGEKESYVTEQVAEWFLII